MQGTFETPILFLIYNRPEITRITFNEIAKIKPGKLYVSADGPKDQGAGLDKCRKTRDVINSVDWDCELELNFSEKNLGCRDGVVAGINWFFAKEEMGIILEDDCVPSRDFFPFCRELLNHYRGDIRIMQISGRNFNRGWKRDSYSYYFSKYSFVHGWATWKRAWSLYDKGMAQWKKIKEKGYYYDLFRSRAEAAVMFKRWNLVQNGILDTWDAQWLFTIMVNNGLSITPNHNMIRNIGFGGDATHTKSASDNVETHYEKMEFPLVHPPFVFEDVVSSRRYIHQVYNKGLKNRLKGIARRWELMKYEISRDPAAG